MELLRYLFISIPYLLAAGLAIGLCAFAVSAFRSPTAGLVLVALLGLFETLLPNAAPIQFGLQIYVPDIVSVMLGMVALMRVLFSRSRAPVSLAWYLFVAVVAVSFAIGLSTYGTTAGGALRPYFYGIAVASYLMTFAMDEAMARRGINAIGWIGLGIILVVFARWVIVSVPIGALLPPGGGFDPTQSSILRVIGADAAAVVGGVFVVGLFYPRTASLLRRGRFLVPLFALAVIGLQHRSVWLAVLAALGARFALPAAGRRGSTQMLALALVLAVAAVPVLVTGRLGGVAQDIGLSANRAVAMTDTAQVRLESWKFAIDKWRGGGPRAWAIGLPLGTSMDRYMVTSRNELRKNTFQAHNYYVQTLFSFGLVGLLANMAVYAWVMLRLYRLAPHPEEGEVASALLLLLTLQLAFYITYGAHYLQALPLGVAAAYAMTAGRRLRQPAAHQGIAAPRPFSANLPRAIR